MSSIPFNHIQTLKNIDRLVFYFFKVFILYKPPFFSKNTRKVNGKARSVASPSSFSSSSSSSVSTTTSTLKSIEEGFVLHSHFELQ